MILFKQEHVVSVREGYKTQTRRLGEKRWNVGAVHQCWTMLFGDPFATVRIDAVRQERLGDISREDFEREGYARGEDYKEAWERIYGVTWDDELLVWVVDFTLVKKFWCGNCPIIMPGNAGEDWEPSGIDCQLCAPCGVCGGPIPGSWERVCVPGLFKQAHCYCEWRTP